MFGRNPGLNLITDKERVRRLAALPHVRSGRLERLGQARVAIVGLGGLGNASAQYLAVQGVGHLTLIDGDVVDEANLGRQVLFSPEMVGRPKVDAARETLKRLQPRLSVSAVPEFLTADNLSDLLAGHDVVVDGLDQAAPRLWINRWARRQGVPVVFAGAIGYEGQVFPSYPDGPCFACLWGEAAGADENCVTSGILGPLVGIVGALQAAEVIKFLIGAPIQPGTLWLVDLLSSRWRTVTVHSHPQCPVCQPAKEAEHATSL
ncbi:MAG: HesA/MoeB/ThiF family protein [Firmicutes bacterium]|nr:HesA/MoeB/ThiF family protein [Bacillota bacterium]